MPIAIDIPEYQLVDEAAVGVRQASTLAEYVEAREYMLEALTAALDGEGRFWGFQLQ